jgi:class 3 adenylate cyclase
VYAGGDKAVATEHRLHHQFAGPRSKVWEALADTARFNEALGLPAHPIVAVTTPKGERQFRGKATLGSWQLEWQDLPGNWVKERWYEHDRLVGTGPVARLCVTLTLSDTDDGSAAAYHILAEPRGVAGRILLATGLLSRIGQSFLRLAHRAERFVAEQVPDPFDLPPPRLDERVQDRIEHLHRELRQAGHPPEILAELVRLLRSGGENDVRRIRPLALARAHDFDPRATVTACLDGARRGLLDLSWDLLCPRCRGAKQRVGSLDQLPATAHCDTCAIRYDRDFSRNVEVTFRPAAGLRPLRQGEFCLLGPMSTPHILVHLTLAPGERRTVEIEVPPGSYRARTLEPGPEAPFEHAGGALPLIELGDAAVTLGPPDAPGRLTLVNRTALPRTAVLEERDWIRDALTADRVAAIQAFRDLFSDQVLRPGDEVGIARVAILFSDLAGSTALYQRIGEAAAFGRVRAHFARLQRIVGEHDGAVVKTIGDAVMAAFADPLDAVRAAIAIQSGAIQSGAIQSGAIQSGEHAADPADPPLLLKIGIHAGPSIAVTLNDRLDYFGSTANLAARLQGAAGPGEIVVSAAMAEDPAIGTLVGPIIRETTALPLRGFAVPVACLRLVPSIGSR